MSGGAHRRRKNPTREFVRAFGTRACEDRRDLSRCWCLTGMSAEPNELLDAVARGESDAFARLSGAYADQQPARDRGRHGHLGSGCEDCCTARGGPSRTHAARGPRIRPRCRSPCLRWCAAPAGTLAVCWRRKSGPRGSLPPPGRHSWPRRSRRASRSSPHGGAGTPPAIALTPQGRPALSPVALHARAARRGAPEGPAALTPARIRHEAHRAVRECLYGHRPSQSLSGDALP